MVREDLIASAVSFLQDPSVASSPVEKRKAFLQSKNLTQEEVDVALARVGDSPPTAGTITPQPSNSLQYGYRNQTAMWQPPSMDFRAHQGGYWHQSQPPQLPRRDWRDWFIMATVMGGVSYGLYFVAKRYVYPMIAPPTPPQLEQDKKAVDESFAKAFALLDQLATDTEAIKSSEEARTRRLDTALAELERVMGELKITSQRREDEGKRFSDEVRGLKDLIPKAMDAQKESADGRLRELNTEMKSLKTLMSTRMGTTGGATGSGRTLGSSAFGSASNANLNGTGANTSLQSSGALNGGGSSTSGPSYSSDVDGQSSGSALPTLASSAGTVRKDSQTAVGGAPSSSRAAIPAWQLAAANKNQAGSPSIAEGGSATEAADGA